MDVRLAMALAFLLSACGASTPETRSPESDEGTTAERGSPEEPVESEPEATPPVDDPAEESGQGLPPDDDGPGLTRSQIQGVFRENVPRFRRCYEERLVLRPGLAGNVSLEIVIAPDGSVASASIGTSSLGDAEAEECLLSVARSLTFPAPGGSDEVVVRYPLAFRGGE